MDTIVYAGDVAPEEIQVTRPINSNDLVLRLTGTTDVMRVTGYFQNDGVTPNSIEQIKFLSDGTVWDVETVKAKALLGTAGGDVLTGYATDDVISGLGGNDTIFGRGGNDVLNGGANRDNLLGEAGNDVLTGGGVTAGAVDTLSGGPGDDTYVFERESGSALVDEIAQSVPGSGFDTLLVSADIAPAEVQLRRITSQNLELRLADGSAMVVDRQFNADGTLAEPIEQIRFAYDGTIWDLRTIRTIITTPTDGIDILWGTDGADVFAGGLADDILRGGRGGDTYLFNVGDGRDKIFEEFELDNPGTWGTDRIIFGSGITSANVSAVKTLTLPGTNNHNLLLSIDGGSGGSVHIEGYFQSGSGACPVEEIHFEDGTVWTDETIAAMLPIIGNDFFGSSGIDEVIGGYSVADVIRSGLGNDQVAAKGGNDVVYGGPGNDFIGGGYGNDRLYGEEGNDTLTNGGGSLAAHAGNNLLDGGHGDDTLDARFGGNDIVIGGPGNDRYLFGLGARTDTIDDVEGNDVIVVDAGISPTQITGLHTATHRILVLNAQDQLFMRWDPATGLQIEQVQFSNGTIWDVATILEKTSTELVTNQPPVLANPIADETAYEDTTFSYTIPAKSFSDPDAGDQLGYSATSADGSALPSWLSFDASAATFSGTPAQEDVGTLSIRVTATDGDGLSAQDVFILDVAPTNDAPTLSEPIADQTVLEDARFVLTMPADMFADVDPGDTLTYAAAGVDGAALPAWLSFDSITRSLSGTPANEHVGTIEIRVVATDSAGATADEAFALEVLNVNDAPEVARQLADQSVEAGSPFVYAVPADAFIDVDSGDSLTLTATAFDGGELPAWLTFDPVARTFSGVPQAADMGIYGFLVRATDESGASASSDFALSVRAVAGSSVSGGRGDDTIAGGTGDETLSGGSGNDALFGDQGDDTLRGGTGNDVLQGGSGDDVLRAGSDQNLLSGGSGDDVIFDTGGDSFIAGGTGNDSIRVGAGNDIIAFNRGDGWDTLYGGGDGGNTLSLGSGIEYSDLSLSKSGDDLILRTGDEEGMVFKDWYAGNQSVLTLQMILDATDEFDSSSSDPLFNRRVQTFSFLGLVAAFDQARAANAALTSWAVSDALTQFHLSGSDEEALGGDLAYWYGKNRSLAGMSVQAAQQVIGAPGFGSDAQTLRPFAGLQEGFVKLGA